MRISDCSSDVCSSDLLVLEDGVRLEAAPPTANRDSPSESGVLEFSRSQIPIDLAGREGFRPRGEDARELTLTELWQQRDTPPLRSEEHTSELQSLMRNSYALFCLKKKL